jgi:IS5 family transposase
MTGKSPDQNQKQLFQPLLSEFINPRHELVILANKIPWKEFEKEYSGLYSDLGQPAKPIRLMVSLLMLKQIFNLGDESLIPEWIRDPYFQYFSGEAVFQWEKPCDPSDLVHFRKRIGQQGVDKILEISVRLQGKKDTRSKAVLVDTTAQEKNITFPTDTKQYRKIINKCLLISEKEGIVLRQSYKRTVKKLMLQQRFSHHPKRKKQADKSRRKLKTIAGRLVRELQRKLTTEKQIIYQEMLELFQKVIHQKITDKDKIYSLHEPDVACIAKGKAHKKYEFGSKVALAVLPKTNIVVGVVNFRGNPNDSQTLEKTLKHSEKIIGRTIKTAIVDRGFRGKKKIGETEIIIPDNGQNKTAYEKRKKRKQCQSRAAIEPVIGHIKHDHRMLRNYLKGTQGDQMNATLAAAAFNFKRLLRKIQQELFWPIDRIKNLISLRPIFNLYLSS